MAAEAENLLRSFDLLPDAEKRQVALEIIRRSVTLEAPPLSDEELVLTAEERFLDLDRGEEEDA